MSLLRTLANTPLRWSLTMGEIVSKRTGAAVPRLLLTVVPAPGAEPVVLHFRQEAGHTPEAMLAMYLAEHEPSNPALAIWRKSRGETPVELEPYALANLGEAMHTALRKLADSKQSVITWNALHHVHPDDRVVVWGAAEKVLSAAFATGEPVLRRDLAATLRNAVVDALDVRGGAEPVTNRHGRLEARTDAQKFALRMLQAGCEMTELEEWMWGWLGYVVKDVAPVPASAGTQPA